MKYPIFIIAIVAALVSEPAFAVDLTVDQTQPILSVDSKTQKWACTELSDATPHTCLRKDTVTLGSLIQDVLTYPLSDATGRASDPTTAKAGSLAIRAYGKDKFVMTLDEIKMVMERAKRIITDPVAMARMEQFLEPAEEKKP